MPNDPSSHLQAGYAEGPCDGFEPPNLGALRALAEGEGLADAVFGIADGYGRRLRDGDPVMPLAREVARALTEAGFALHRCGQHEPLHQLGGVCLLPVARGHDPDGDTGAVVSWTTHDLLSKDWDRGSEYYRTQDVMNSALAQVLDAAGFRVRPFGVGGAPIVTGLAEDRRVVGGEWCRPCNPDLSGGRCPR